MINVNELKGRIVAKGYTQTDVANKIGITPKTFSTKLKKGVLNSKEIEKLIDILDIKNPIDIFFVDNVTQ